MKRVLAIVLLGILTACGDDDGGSAAAVSPPAKDAGVATSTLYVRLGGKDAIRTLLGKVVAAELADPEVASFFPFTPGAPGNGHPAGGAILECFTNQLGAAAGGPANEVTYPAVVDNGGTAFTCRDMPTSHAGLGIYAGVFDKFVAIAGGVMQANGVTAADVTTITGVLASTKPDIVTSQRVDDAGYKDGAP